MHFHGESATALRHGGEIGAGRIGHGDLGLHDDGRFVVHARNAAATAVEVAHDAAGEFVGNGDFDMVTGFSMVGLACLDGFWEGNAPGCLERQFVRIDIVVGAVVESRP